MKPGLTIELGRQSTHTAWLRGSNQFAATALESIGSKRMWDADVGRWKFPVRRVDDLLAWAGFNGYCFELTVVDR